MSIVNFIKIEITAKVFSCEFCEIFKNTFLTERLKASAFVYRTVIFIKY